MVEFWRAGGPGALNPMELARAVEADGWDGQMFMDSQCLSADPWVLMASWAAATERLKLCTGVSNPLTRHNAVTAACASTLQAISGGRAVLGIGRGDSALAYLGLAPVGLSAFERALTEIQALLSGKAVAFGGTGPGADAPSLDTMSLGDRPTESRLEWLPEDMVKVPLDVAATGPKVIEMSALISERVTFSVGAIPDRINWALDIARTARAAKGLTDDGIAYGAQIIVVCHPDVELVRPYAGSFVAPLARFQVIQGEAKGPMSNSDAVNFAAIRKGYDMTKHGKGGAHGKLVGNEISPDFIDRFAIVGPPDHCIERLLQLIGFGIERFVVVGPGLHPEVEEGGRTLFAREVMPSVRAAMEEKTKAKVPA
jgi:5,10-methylenetetrahydromethanopterin reductase